GAGDREAVSRTVHTAALTALLGGTALLFVGFFGCPLFLSWMDTPEDVIDLAVRYMRIYFLSVPAMFVFNFCAAALRASGDTRHPTRYLVIAGAVNVVLNLLTAAVFRLGVTGVAAATTVSQYLSAVLLVSFLRRRGDACRLEWGKLRIDGGKLKEIMRIGIPAGLQSAAFSISNVLIQSSINSFGSLAVEANTIAHNIDSFLNILCTSFGQASLAFVGQNVGARRYGDLRRITAICVGLSAGITLLVGAVMYVFRVPVISLFLRSKEETLAELETVLEYTSIRMLAVTTTYFLGAVLQTLMGALRGMGASLSPTVASLVGVCLSRIVWIWTVFAADRTLWMLFLCYPASWILASAIQLVLLALFRRRLQRGGDVPLDKARTL
ncbi:MAG: MATE family efflux transporter, partial [Clostridia bacterium]|nr:MATE family efflux transporter [Clostridia bacterium]